MAMIDYGAILRVDGKIVNNELFMEVSDTGYIPPEKVTDDAYEEDIYINGNYFVYAGDEDFLVCFYKTSFVVIYDGRVVLSRWGFWYENILSYTHYLNKLPSITISRLDKNKHCSGEDLLDYVDYYELIEEARKHNKKRELLRWQRVAKRIYRNRKAGRYQYYSQRFVATWDYDGRHYECIYGYGIDPNKEVWGEIKHKHYDFSDTERRIIDSWFEGESSES